MLCYQLRHTLSVFLISFLLNHNSLAEETIGRSKSTVDTKVAVEPEGRALFNPRVEYSNQWLPVGHSDPLNNDPTFDYSPPTIERVRFWSELSDEGNNNNGHSDGKNSLNEKSEILLLGVPMKNAIFSHNSKHPNPAQTEPKSNNNRRSSVFYPPEPSRVLTPPPMHMPIMDQHAYQSDYSYQYANYWNNELPPYQPNDAYVDESASILTVIRPKTSPNPYASTLYNKDVRNSIYHLAANVNSLESSEKKKPWVQSLLQPEISYQPQMTTPQVVLAYSPHIYEAHSAAFKSNGEKSITAPTTERNVAMMTTTPVPMQHTQPTVQSRQATPVYQALIIQGHSKVKTYGADSSDSNKAKHEPKMVPVVPNKDPVVKHVVSEDNVIQVKHLHKLHSSGETKTKSAQISTKKPINSPMASLLSLLDSSLASFSLEHDKKSRPLVDALKKSNSTQSNKGASLNQQIITSITGPTTVPPPTSASASVFS